MITRKAEAAGLLAGLLCLAAFQGDRWQYRAAVAVTPGAVSSSAKLTRDILVRTSPHFEDIRLVHEGREVPFVLITKTGSVKETEVAAAIIDKELAGGNLRFTLDLGSVVRHSRIHIHTSKQNFRQRVKLESSEDNRRWVVVRDDAWIFDYHQDGGTSVLTSLDYPASTRRYLRVTVFGWNEPEALSGVSITSRTVEPPERETVLAAPPQVIAEPKNRSTLCQLDLKVDRLPHDYLVLEAEQSFFHRAAELETSSDGKEWRWRTSAALYLLPGESRLEMSYPETRDRYLRLRIFNQDNRAVAIRSITVQAINRYIQFDSQIAGQYWIYAGNDKASTPAYDLPLILARQTEQPLAATLGSVQSNPEFHPAPVPAKPWSERHPALLYSVLTVSVLGMGYVAFSLLRKVLSSPPEA